MIAPLVSSAVTCRRALCAAVFLVLPFPAHADVYYFKDTDGQYHFTNEPRPDAAPFIVDRPASHLPPEEIDGRVPDPDDYDPIIDRWAKSLRVEHALVKAIIRASSGFNSKAVSPDGAKGLMQLMPKTARYHRVRNIFDPEQNIEGGVRYLRELLDHHGNNITRVVAAYVAGSEAVDKHHGIPPDPAVQDYVAKVLRFREQYLKRGREAQIQEAPR